jgi:cysteine desulfurase family protein (TIGR01976 family)
VTATTSIANGHAVASLETIRAQFPALQRKHNGLPVAYFDGPGGTQVPTMVADAMRDYLLHHNANTHWAYPTSAETDAMLNASRAALADLFNATPSDIVFGNNMTTLNFHLARALSAWWKAGDEVVITDLDHHANVAPWQRLVKEKGIVLKHVGVHLDSGQLDWSSLERAITKKTKLLAIGAGSNALGTITDVAAAAKLAHAVGALVLVDAVHYAPHSLVDVHAMDCDFLGVSAYKFYGPHVGVMFARATIVEALDAPKLEPSPNYAPDRLETGTLNHDGMVGAGAAVEFLASLAEGPTRRARLEATYAVMHDRGQALLERLWSGLGALPKVTLYGPTPDQPRTPTIAFTVKGHDSEAVARHLAEHALFLSHGDFYAATIVSRLGLGEAGLVRAGAACYTSEDEVDRLIAAVKEM